MVRPFYRSSIVFFFFAASMFSHVLPFFLWHVLGGNGNQKCKREAQPGMSQMNRDDILIHTYTNIYSKHM